MIKVKYNNDTLIETEAEVSVLELSLRNKINHLHACGGNARCSTCRFLVLKNPEHLSKPTEAESNLILERGFEDGIRLGCQAKVQGDVEIRLLVRDNLDYEDIKLRKQKTTGREDNLAILFSDIRSFTTFSENNLPYDIIHILNRYFEVMGQIVLDNGGYLDKYIGDGLMANFGLKQNDPVSICLRAVDAGLKMIDALEGINEYAKSQLNHEFKIGIGIHYGNVIVGELGHHSNAAFTLIGDAVNQASRVESMTKKAGVSILISQQVYDHVNQYVTIGKRFIAPLKGKTGKFHLYEVKAVNREEVRKYLNQGGRLELREIQSIGSEIYSIAFDKPPQFSYKPGQFIDIYLDLNSKTELDSNVENQSLDLSKMVSHSFSISSTPEENEIRIITKNTNSEYKKKLLSMTKGMSVYSSEPMGNLGFYPMPNIQHVFIAGGIGITPFYSMIRNRLDLFPENDILLLQSSKDFDSLIYYKEWVRLDSEDTGFRYCPTITSAVPKDWNTKYEKGRLNMGMIARQVNDIHSAIFYITGNPVFVEEIAEELSLSGVSLGKIQREEFYGY
ncbi:adenylate/guanylate cyclase domain-containing protein [Leptospira sp. GIMC2001]|uniref:adenylate/guanylate cyclase domain-containing protein n=1 Tax=Leptospira sp. GIMC2001 TaxID=1513297 RepID=UPI00234B0B6B|nr:adenylate/guanylate cyclase domain-containing protein [Leptospira sp. GIMC2001]WCL50436.1 2Fe-2S iron-sulfur cluster-binding protein [Leptospira sp. GIMC2001]